LRINAIISLISILFLSISSTFSQGQIINTYQVSSFDSLVLESLTKKKIVMIGDGYHGHGYYYNLVIGSLNYWLDNVSDSQHQKPVPEKLFLFLESDSTSGNLINNIINNNEKEEYLTYRFDIAKFGGIEQISIDVLKFYTELRSIKNRINDLNKNNSAHKIEIRICVAESTPPCDVKKSVEIEMDSCKKENDYWFVHERDQLSSNKIISVLEENKNFKALIFYGGGHLIRENTDKRPGMNFPSNEPAMGYFLAHYLDEKFGRNNVAVFTSFNTLETETGYVNEYKQETYEPDFIISNKIIPPSPFPLLFIKSNLILKSFFNLINLDKERGFFTYRNNSYLLMLQFKRSYLYANPVFKEIIDSLKRYNLQLFRGDSSNYEKALLIHDQLIKEFDAVENINQIDTWIFSTNIDVDSIMYFHQIRAIIYNLPVDTTEEIFNSRLNKSFNRLSLNDFEYSEIDKRINEIKIYSLINLLWIADLIEYEKAIKYLNETTGENIYSADDWYKWWMAKYKSKNGEN
jgi:hypothetical protein